MLRVAAGNSSTTRVVHLLASRSFGGKERQIFDLTLSLPPQFHSTILLFSEDGEARRYYEHLAEANIPALILRHDSPRFRQAIRELVSVLKDNQTSILCCHDYKSAALGLPAARRCGVPVVSVSHGWTAETLKVRLYETLDRRVLLRRMDQVICVSQAQADKVTRAGVPQERISVICNAVNPQRFSNPNPAYKTCLQALFQRPVKYVIGAAGRLSPEKGFDILVKAAAQVNKVRQDVGFVLFGDGALASQLKSAVSAHDLETTFILAGHCKDLDGYLPFLDVFVLPSYTEGLPNVVLESLAASVPVVATAVGGTPEVLLDGECGYLVPSGDAQALADRILKLCASDEERLQMGQRGQQRIMDHFTFEMQSRRYADVFSSLGTDVLGTAACR